MLRFFRSTKITVIVSILFIGTLMWLRGLLMESEEITSTVKYGTFLFDTLIEWLNCIPGLSIWVGLLFFLLTVLMLVFMNVSLRLLAKFSYLPALCYVLLIGGIPHIHMLNPVIIAVIILMIAFIYIVDSFESEQLSYNYFTASALISLSTFFYQYMYVYMLVVWIVIALWRPGYWREWVFTLLGFALPVFFAFSWFFLVDDDISRISIFFYEISDMQRIMPALSIYTLIFFAVISALAISTFLYTMRYIASKKTVVRTGNYVLVIIAVVTAGMICAVPDTIPFAWYLLAFPISIFISCYLENVKSKLWGNIVLTVLFVMFIFMTIVK